MKIKPFLLILACGLFTVEVQAQDLPLQAPSYKGQVAQWAKKHPLLYNIAWVHGCVGLSVTAGYLYAKTFIPHLLNKNYPDSGTGIHEFVTDMKETKTGLHTAGALASSLGTLLGLRTTFLQDLYDQSSEKQQLLAALSLIPSGIGIAAILRYLR